MFAFNFTQGPKQCSVGCKPTISDVIHKGTLRYEHRKTITVDSVAVVIFNVKLYFTFSGNYNKLVKS